MNRRHDSGKSGNLKENPKTHCRSHTESPRVLDSKSPRVLDSESPRVLDSESPRVLDSGSPDL